MTDGRVPIAGIPGKGRGRVNVNQGLNELSFLLPCPNCGPRSVYEFQFGGEYHRRPHPQASPQRWYRYLYLRKNVAGDQVEWWYHHLGCRCWFLAVRDTRLNQVRSTLWPEELMEHPLADPLLSSLNPDETTG